MKIPKLNTPLQGQKELRKKSDNSVPVSKKQAANKARSLALTKHDWDGARQRFVTAVPAITLKAVSQEFNIPYPQVRRKAGAERWTYVRAKEQAEAAKKKRQEHLAKMADEAIKFDNVTIDAARVGMALVAGRLVEISKQFAASQVGSDETIRKLQTGQPVDWKELRSVINYKELTELSSAARNFQEIGRKAFGTDTQDFNIHVDGAVEHIVNIGDELAKDDPARLASMLEAFERAGIVSLNVGEEDDEEGDDFIEGTFVSDEVVEQLAITQESTSEVTGPEEQVEE